MHTVSRDDRLYRLKGRRSGPNLGRFLALPHQVFLTPAFAALSGRAVKLLIELGLQYSGSNNGDLTAAFRVLRPRGFSSSDQLRKARDELLGAGWIVIARQGGRHAPTLYAITIWAVDPCGGKIEIKPGPPMHLWKPEHAGRRDRTPDSRKSSRRVHKASNRDTDQIGPPHGAMLVR